MPVHQRVRAWITQNYQKPAIDQEWLADCSDWLSSELGLDPDTNFDKFIQHVEAQLLQSNLADSTVPGSGIDPLLVASDPNAARPRPSGVRRPGRQATRRKTTTGPTPLLVEVKSVTEIAHSAFSLLNIHQTRLDRADLGLAQEENAEQEDEGPVPRFPRGMLKFELSDGLTTLRAIEFRSLPELELATTPLGYKMFLRSTPIRNGIAFLEPTNVTLKGYRTEDHDVNREQVFLSSLRKRLGRPDPPPDAPVAAQPRVDPPGQPAPVQPAHQHQAPPAVRPPSPPADIDDMYVDDDVDPDVLREMAIQIDEATDAQLNQCAGVPALPPAGPPSISKEEQTSGSNSRQTLRLNTTVTSSLKNQSASSTVKTSPYFTAHSAEPKMGLDIGLSPRPAPLPNPDPDFDITWDIDEQKPPKPPVKSAASASTKPPSTAPVRRVISPRKRPLSPDPYDDLSFDMEVNESFFEQVGMIEHGALHASADKGKGKGKGKDTGTEVTTSHSRASAASARKGPSASVLGTKPLAKSKRATSPSPVSDSTDSHMPQSTQSSGHCLPRDPSLIIVSSGDEEPRGDRTARVPGSARKRAAKRRALDQAQVADSEVIDISD